MGIILSVFTCNLLNPSLGNHAGRRFQYPIFSLFQSALFFLLRFVFLRRRLSSQTSLLVFRSFCRSSVSSVGASLFCPNSFGAWFSFTFSFRFYESRVIGLNYLRYSHLRFPTAPLDFYPRPLRYGSGLLVWVWVGSGLDWAGGVLSFACLDFPYSTSPGCYLILVCFRVHEPLHTA